MAKKWLIVLLAALFVLSVASFAWANVSNTPAIRTWVIGSGGRRISSGGTVVQSTIGQPLAYRAVSGTSELCAGFWCGAAGEYEVFLPAVMNQFSTCFPGPSEIEPNDQAGQANGPLCSAVNYSGTSDHNGSAQDSDYFYIEMSVSGTVNILVTNFLSNHAQVQLYADPVSAGTLLAVLADQPGGSYSIVYSGGPGRYYIRVVATDGHEVGQGPYTLRVTFP